MFNTFFSWVKSLFSSEPLEEIIVIYAPEPKQFLLTPSMVEKANCRPDIYSIV